MESIEEKLVKFEEDCIGQAQNDAEELQNQLKDKINKYINDEMSTFNTMQELKYNRKMKELENEYHANIYSLQIEAKQKIMEKKEELKERFIEELQEKLKEFVKSDNYENFLLSNIETTLQKTRCDANDNVCVYITQNDTLKFQKVIEQRYININLEIMDDIYIGGCQCFCDSSNIFIDNTLKLAIEEQVQDRRW